MFSGEQNSDDANVDDICRLFRSTGFLKQQVKRTPNYPEEYFKYRNIIMVRFRFSRVFY